MMNEVQRHGDLAKHSCKESECIQTAGIVAKNKRHRSSDVR